MKIRIAKTSSTSSNGVGGVRSALELLSLWTLAVTQPVFADIASDPGSLLLRQSTTADVAVFSLTLALVPPFAIGALTRAMRHFNPAIARGVHIGTLMLLTIVWIAQIAMGAGAANSVSWLAGGILAACLLLAYVAFQDVQTWLQALAGLPIFLLVWFMFLSPVHTVLDPTAGSSAAADGPSLEPTPVLFLIFDEFPTVSLMDPEGNINAELFPNFARLASTATWYPDHTVAAQWTWASVPSILTGRKATSFAMPSAEQYPDNLFTLLGKSHLLNVQEYTALCPSSLECRSAQFAAGGKPLDLIEMASDIIASRTHLSASSSGDKGGNTFTEAEVQLDLDYASIGAGVPRSIDAFMGLYEPDGQPRVDYGHLLLPHQPWLWAGGVKIPDAPVTTMDSYLGIWNDDQAARQNLARHILQLQKADAVLGEVLDRLEASGTFDQTLVVATGDHGIAFQGKQAMRAAFSATLTEIYWAPLIIKYPDQTKGERVTTPVSSIDVMPTIAAALGGELPWDADGESLIPRPPENRSERTLFVGEMSDLNEGGGRFELENGRFYPEVLAIASERGIRTVEDLGRFGPYSAMVGDELGDYARDGAESTLTLTKPSADQLAGLKPDADELPIWLEGRSSDQSVTAVAVTVDERIVAAVPARTFGQDRYFWWVVAPSLLSESGSTIGVHEILGPPESPVIRG